MVAKIYELNSSIIVAGVFLTCMVAGFIASKFVFSQIGRAAAKLSGDAGEIVARALNGIPLFMGVIGGVYGVIHFVRLQTDLFNDLEDILLAAAVLAGTIVVARISSGLVSLYARKAEGLFPSTSILDHAVQLVVYLIGGLIMMQAYGISVAPILTAFGIGGLAIALALQDTLSNLFSGLYILLSRQIHVGDYIRLSTGEEGHVLDITWRSTTIKATTNNVIVLPNHKIAAATITNYFLPEKEMSIVVPVDVSQECDLEHVERVTVAVAREVLRGIDGGVEDFEPTVRFHTFGDYSIHFDVTLRVKEYTDQYLVRHDFIKRLQKRYRAEGIELPVPARTVHVRPGAADTAPLSAPPLTRPANSVNKAKNPR